jgi:hypothetical protein
MPQVDSTAIDISKHTTTKPQINTLNASRLGLWSSQQQVLHTGTWQQGKARRAYLGGRRRPGPHVRPAAPQPIATHGFHQLPFQL